MKKLMTFLMMSILAIGVGWAAEVTVEKTMTTIAAENSWIASSGNDIGGLYTSFALDANISISTTGTPNCGSYWSNGNDWRLYQNQNGNVIVTAKDGYILKKATFTYNKNNGGLLSGGADTGTEITLNGTSVTFEVINSGTATNGQVRITKISITYEEEGSEPDPESPTATVSFNPAGGEVDYGTTVALSLNGEADGIKYTLDGNDPTSTSNTYNGPISITEATTIKAAAFNSGNGKYAFGEVSTASYTIKEVEATNYSRVTQLSADDVGKQFLLVCESKTAGMGAVGTVGTYGVSISLSSLSAGVASITNEQVVPVTLGGSADAWTFETPDGKFLSWASGNSLDKVDVDDEEGNIEWKIEFTGNNVFIKNKTENTRVIKYNSGSPRFACYTSSQTDIQLYRLVESGVVVTAPIISGTDNFEESTQITITAQDGASIYYTTDESTPTTASTKYTAPFTITETTTVKAIAVVDETSSSVATATFTAKPLITSVAQFNALAVGDNFKYTADNLVALAKNGNQLYVQDGEKGMLIYGSIGQTYERGDKIPGGFTGTRATKEGAPEMTNPAGFTASTQNVEVTPVEITPNGVNLANFGRYAIIKNATFNTSAKTITASGETIAYYTTFMSGTPDNDVVYDIVGVCGYYQNNPQFLPISYTPVVTTGPDYYLLGSFNEWAQKDENYKFTALADGSWKLTKKTMPDDVLFKILKVDGDDVTWLGGSASDYFGISKDVCTNIQLVDGANFKMEAGGICTFTVSADQKLSVSKEPQLFMRGSFSDDDWATKAELEATNNGWNIEMALEVDDEFKFMDEWGTWYGGGNTISEANLGSDITLDNGGNFKMATGGNFVINVANDKSKFVITRKVETNSAMFDFDNKYAELFPNLNLTSLPYDIEDPITATVDGISVTISAKTTSSTANRIYNTTPRLRVYSGTITITAPEGYNLTGIDISQGKWNDGNSADNGVLSSTGWIGETHILVISIAGNTQIDDMTVTITKINENTPKLPVIDGESPFVGSTQVTITCETEGAAIYYTTDGNDPTTASTLYQGPFNISDAVTVKARAYSQGGVASQIATKVFEKIPSIENLTAFYNYTGTDEFAFTGNLVAIAQSGKYIYAQDDAKGVLIYDSNSTNEHTYQKGDKIPAGFFAKKASYHGAPQMAYPIGMQPSTEQATIEPVELTIAKASQENQEYLYRYAVIKNATYQSGKLVDGEEEIAIYNRFTTEITPIEGKAYNVIGIVGWFDGAQFMPLEYEQAPVVLEGVSFTNGRHWATWCGDDMLVMPEGVIAYVVTGVSDDKVQIAEKDVVNSEEGVLLYCAGEMAEVKATVVTGATNAAVNMLEGCLTATAVNEPAYVLYNNQFVLLQDGTTIGAHRCYLPASVLEEPGQPGEPTGAPVLRIAMPGTVTGIDDLRYDSNGKAVGYYDLTGRYIGTSLNGKRGIFITSDGKKVVK